MKMMKRVLRLKWNDEYLNLKCYVYIVDKIHEIFPLASMSENFHIYSTYTPYTLPMHSTYTPYTLPIHSTYTPYTLPIDSLYTSHTLHIHSLYTPYALQVNSMNFRWSLCGV
jgi:hypothetical protein